MREVYAERCQALAEGARTELAEWLELPRIEAGLQTTARLRQGIPGDRAVTAAAERGVEAISLARYCRDGARMQGLVLGFAAVDAKEIGRGVRQLASALRSVPRRRRRG
jgi:GntR family transcriptional regulator/MocR family aminotransferase